LLRLFLHLRTLPPGPLRDRLEGAAKRLNCRCTDVLVWNTRQGVVNAMVVGVTPWLRYILLSDRLLEELTADEIEAVFGHEAGHVRHLHMALYLAFLTGSVVLLSKASSLLAPVMEGQWPESYARIEEAWLALPSLAFLAAYIFGVFGFLSRRCERQADVFGCRAVSCTQPNCGGHDETTELAPGGRGLCSAGIMTFCGALDKVAVLNGISRSRPGWLHSWQHSTIAKRIDFLHHLMENPALEARFQRRVFWVKTFMLAATVLALVGVWLWS
jgi:STE24 endopeptidase